MYEYKCTNNPFSPTDVWLPISLFKVKGHLQYIKTHVPWGEKMQYLTDKYVHFIVDKMYQI